MTRWELQLRRAADGEDVALRDSARLAVRQLDQQKHVVSAARQLLDALAGEPATVHTQACLASLRHRIADLDR